MDRRVRFFILTLLIYGHSALAQYKIISKRFKFEYDPHPTGAVIRVKNIKSDDVLDSEALSRPVFSERSLNNSFVFFDEAKNTLLFVEFNPERERNTLDLGVGIYPLSEVGTLDPWNKFVVNLTLQNWPHDQGQLEKELLNAYQFSPDVLAQLRNWLITKTTQQ